MLIAVLTVEHCSVVFVTPTVQREEPSQKLTGERQTRVELWQGDYSSFASHRVPGSVDDCTVDRPQLIPAFVDEGKYIGVCDVDNRHKCSLTVGVAASVCFV